MGCCCINWKPDSRAVQFSFQIFQSVAIAAEQNEFHLVLLWLGPAESPPPTSQSGQCLQLQNSNPRDSQNMWVKSEDRIYINIPYVFFACVFFFLLLTIHSSLAQFWPIPGSEHGAAKLLEELGASKTSAWRSVSSFGVWAWGYHGTPIKMATFLEEKYGKTMGKFWWTTGIWQKHHVWDWNLVPKIFKRLASWCLCT